MRTERDLTIDEIAERLAIPRTTVYYWVRDLPLRAERESWKLGQVRAAEATRLKHQRLREEAYALGRAQWDQLEGEPTFREFVALYIAEGYKRSRNTIAICNSDPRVMAIAVSWFRRITDRKLDFQVQYHADQSTEELQRFWASSLRIDPDDVGLQPKPNSSQMQRRTWRCEHGVLTVRTNDTLVRARVQAWMDQIREEWTLECAQSLGV